MAKYCIIIEADTSRVDPSIIPEFNLNDWETSIGPPYTFLALVDRTKTKEKWWTQELKNIMRFESKDAADLACSKLKYGNPQVVKESTMLYRTTNWFLKVRSSGLGRALAEKQMLWHDDDWHESAWDD